MTYQDDDAVVAAADLVGRSGATGFEIGYNREGVPVEQADWWASAHYSGARITIEHRTSPVEAADALARRLLDRAQCQFCGQLIGYGCKWSRHGAEWQPRCAAGQVAIVKRKAEEGTQP